MRDFLYSDSGAEHCGFSTPRPRFRGFPVKLFHDRNRLPASRLGSCGRPRVASIFSVDGTDGTHRRKLGL